MGSLLTFSNDSAAKVFQEIQPHESAEAPIPEEFLSSRLLSRQVKHVMNKLHRDTYSKVLEVLERSMRSRTRDSWGTSFCAILIMCLCIEGLQTAADILVVCDRKINGDGSEYSRVQSYEACSQLDKYPFQQCVRLFHDIYKSHREGNGGGREPGFNPLKAIGDGNTTGLDTATEFMVKRVYKMTSERCKFSPSSCEPASLILSRP